MFLEPVFDGGLAFPELVRHLTLRESFFDESVERGSLHSRRVAQKAPSNKVPDERGV